MEASASSGSLRERRSNLTQTGSYTLRKVLSDIPLSAEGNHKDIKITCAEFWNDNLYIGTSAAEILHFVLIPPEPSDPFGQPSFIIASRLQPGYTQNAGTGVQQILILPKVNKACVICNNALTFYSLPELSPAFASQKPISCLWVGGVDLNGAQENDSELGVVVMMCLRTRMQLVRIGEEPRRIRNIEFGGCLSTSRRDGFACVADAHSYALLDVVHQQKIPLFPISSLDEEATAHVGGASEDISITQPGISRSVSASSAVVQESVESPGPSDPTRLVSPSPRPPKSTRHGFDTPDMMTRSFTPSPAQTPPPRTTSPPSEGAAAADKALPPVPPEVPEARQPSPPAERKPITPLRPHVLSPTPTEFLLTTGTTPEEPGVGMFVNLDGDVVRGTLEFETYPEALITDGFGIDPAMSISSSISSGDVPEEGFVLAVIKRRTEAGISSGVEIQRWDLDPGENAASREWLNLGALPSATTDDSPQPTHSTQSLGIRTVTTESEVSLTEISDVLSPRRLHLRTRDSTGSQSGQVDQDAEDARAKDESAFTSSLCRFKTRNMLWNDNEVWWVVRNPLIAQLDAKLRLAQNSSPESDVVSPRRQDVEFLLNSMRGLEPRTEAEYLGFNYIRQKASLLLVMDLIIQTNSGIAVDDLSRSRTEEALKQGEVDPRIILALLPLLRDEVLQGKAGIWIQGGIQNVVEGFLLREDLANMSLDPTSPLTNALLQLVKRYLLRWRKKKGFGSVSDEKEVFLTVDAALLHVLLVLDTCSPPGPATAGSLRAELNSLVDNGVDCWDRAIQLLEEYSRLYVLSRLYQSRKQAGNVLATWRRIMDTGTNKGDDFPDAEMEFRKYLGRIRDRSIVEEYGTWLANRNPKLGVQVFADENSRVRFRYDEAVDLLKSRAPGAVKEYLEYLVYGKKQTQYANHLISFYLDIVVEKLQTSPEAKETLLQTYETYRALRAPKPTYRQFITENSFDAEWWHSRLRLLQLLGTGQDAASSYRVDEILTRLAPFERELVPEMIILNGRQGRHEHAIRLLTHGLGDFDMAISYCLLGGSSIYRPTTGGMSTSALPSHEEQAHLFGYLLHEFLRIEDISDRIERTGELLERFGGWFDVQQVLGVIPDDWSIDIFSGFLINAFRRLVREKNETSVARALSGATNLSTSVEVIEKMESVGPRIISDGAGGQQVS
ncbi:hypothetical protein HDK90DRAFT_486441 [Phyllosticta capitalensis]|uniref:CNH domain-containing protein n=1 Tax=Phyllosticta capitalensis TaxID=121624 RepID=A0ABR1YLJ0_9PEZI